MISVIICSRKKEINEGLLSNIANTIGCKYELIIVDNSDNKYSIFEAYNFGIKKSKGDFFCYVHDDVLFHTKDWGQEVLKIFEHDKKIGLIGVAGAKIKTRMPSTWWDCPEQFKIINIIQHFKSGIVEHLHQGWNEVDAEEVVVVDGVFMIGRNIDEIYFSKLLTGFHNYDLNLSLEYIKCNYKIIVTNKILLEHFSQGELNTSWCQSTIKIHDLYSDILPIKVSSLSQDLSSIEFKNGCKFLLHSLNIIDRKSRFILWIQLFKIKAVSKFHINFLFHLIRKCWQ